MLKTEDNRTLFIKLIDWLLTKFPNDPTLMHFKSCQFGVHDWILWWFKDPSHLNNFKHYHKRSKCGKERKNL